MVLYSALLKQASQIFCYVIHRGLKGICISWITPANQFLPCRLIWFSSASSSWSTVYFLSIFWKSTDLVGVLDTGHAARVRWFSITSGWNSSWGFESHWECSGYFHQHFQEERVPVLCQPNWGYQEEMIYFLFLDFLKVLADQGKWGKSIRLELVSWLSQSICACYLWVQFLTEVCLLGGPEWAKHYFCTWISTIKYYHL